MTTEPEKKAGLNRVVLSVFAPLLLLTGIAGFIVPSQYSLTSGAMPYNLFHILFGAIGLLIVSLESDIMATGFNLVFGLIDLYQVIASVFALTPIQYFHWTLADDLLHIIFGLGLVAIAIYSLQKLRQPRI